MFRISRYSVVVFGVLFAWSLANRADAIRYELIDGAGGDQDGHTLAGFIEFDSPCGKICTSANVTDFTFAVSGPNNYSYSYQIPADVLMNAGQVNQPFLIAGPSYLSVDYGNPGFLTLQEANDNAPYILWSQSLSSYYSSAGPNFSGGWQDRPPLATVATIGKVIPEPATGLLSSMTLSLLSRRRKRF